MREKWARAIALLTGVLVVVLAVVFAHSRNPAAPGPDRHAPRTEGAAPDVPAPTDTGRALDASRIERGRAVYDEQGCAGCHSIAGRGSPRSPLDDVGRRLGADEILRWITPATGVADSYQARHARRITLSADQRESLLAYLLSLGADPAR